MAKTSQLARNRKREKLVAKYAVKRAALKAAGDYEGLQKLPKPVFTLSIVGGSLVNFG